MPTAAGARGYVAKTRGYRGRTAITYARQQGYVQPRVQGRTMYRRGGYNRSIGLRNARTGGLLGIETKFLDIPIAAVALSAGANAESGEIQPTGIVTGCLSAPAQGDGATNRDGKKIIVQSTFIQGSINCSVQSLQATADSVPSVYLALVQDTQTNGVTIVSEDVFTNPCASANCNSQPFRNMSNSSRFRVLKSKTIMLRTPSMANDTGATGGVIQSGFNVPFKLSWKGAMPVNFSVSSTTADVANVIDNSLHLIAYTTSGTLIPTIYASCRIRFVG